MKLASFDIFDTTLLRLCGNAENIFYILSKRLFPNDFDKQKYFMLWRQGAEHQAQKKSCAEVTIGDIYSSFPHTSFPEYNVSQIIQAEMDIERQMLLPRKSVVEIIKSYREKDYAIAFISDMYLHSDFLTSVLMNADIMQNGDHLFVSCDCNCRKSTGQMYEYVRQILHPSEWIHHGDNLYSDIRMASKHGIKTKQINSAFSNFNKRLISLGSQGHNAWDTSILAGVNRYHTLNSSSPEEFFAAQYVAPMYSAYLNFICQKTLEQGYTKLYFLARDSYVLREGFKQINHKGISSSFFFVSRKSLLIPFFYACDTADEFIGAYPNRSLIGKRVSTILDSLGLPNTCLSNKFSFTVIETKMQQSEFLETLFLPENKEIKNRCKQQYDLFVQYLLQEGILSDGKSAMVDVGWVGTTRLMLTRILSSLGRNSIDFIYYAVEPNVLPFEYGRFSFFTQINGYMTPYIEQYYSECPYPSTIGYKMEGNVVQPVFTEGQQYKETAILEANVSALKSCMHSLTLLPALSDTAFQFWSYNSGDSLVNFRDDIDYSVLADVEKFKHERQIASRWTTTEKVKFLLGIKMHDCLQEPSAIISFGYKFGKFYYPISKKLRKNRNCIEKKISNLIKKMRKR